MSEIAQLFSSESLTQRVAAEVRAHAARQGIQQKDLARLLGLNPSGVTHRMRGRVPFTLDEIEKLADVFQVDYADLMPKRRTAGASAGETPAVLAEVGHQGLEPRTRWFGIAPARGDESTSLALADVIPLTPERRSRTDQNPTPNRGVTSPRFAPIPVHCAVSS